MAVKVKVNLKELDRTIRLIPNSINTREIAQSVIERMKNLISKGISPIEGNGRFPAYKAPYPKSVRENFKGKRPRPVNLFLSGKFLRHLTYRIKSKTLFEIGFFTEYGEDLETGHRESSNSRPIIPQAGESFVNSIRLAMLKFVRKSVEVFLNAR